MMSKRKFSISFASLSLVLTGIAAASLFSPFLEGMPRWLGASWLILFLTTFVLTVINFNNWFALLGLVSLVFTFAIWTSV